MFNDIKPRVDWKKHYQLQNREIYESLVLEGKILSESIEDEGLAVFSQEMTRIEENSRSEHPKNCSDCSFCFTIDDQMYKLHNIQISGKCKGCLMWNGDVYRTKEEISCMQNE